MANILKVTTPSTDYENRNQNVGSMAKNKQDLQVQLPVDPTRVTRPGQEAEAENKTEQWKSFDLESNFGNFIRMLKDTPQLIEIFPQLLFSATTVEAGLGENFAQEISSFLQMFQLDESQIEGFVREQADGAVKFSGPFFELMRQLMSQSKSVDLKAGILEFMKHYDSMASGSHLLSRMDESLQQMAGHLLRSDRQALQELTHKLNLQAHPGETTENSRVLKEDIIPWLASFVRKTHDRGMVRNLISMLTLDTARYENGDEEVILKDLKTLFAFPGVKEAFGGLTEEELTAQLIAHAKDGKTEQSGWTEHFVEAIRQGMSGSAGAEGKQVFQNLMNAILLNESVYMPVMHMMLPIQMDGRMMFSEMWVDPDSPKKENGGGGGRRVKMLIKFDIKDVGFFDLVMYYQDGQAELQLSCPKALRESEDGIKVSLNRILEDKGIGVRNIALAYGAPSRKVSEVFPQIFERSNSVNVRV